MIIGVPKELSIDKIRKEVDAFSSKNKLTTQEKDELNFIMRSFCKYYNKMSDSSSMFEQEDIIESFDGILETITETYNGTGTQTRANLFWKFIPTVDDMRKSNTSSKKTNKKRTYDDDDNSYTPPKRTSSKPSYSSYGSCGSSSSYSSYGGCGGGGGYSSGGHC